MNIHGYIGTKIDTTLEDGAILIEVLIKDKETQELIGAKLIKRATLAKLMQPLSGTHVSALNGKFVIEV